MLNERDEHGHVIVPLRQQPSSSLVEGIQQLIAEWRQRAHDQREVTEYKTSFNPAAMLAMADANSDRADQLAALLAAHTGEQK